MACRDYVWPADTPLAGRVVGKLLGGETPSDAEFLGLVPETRAVAKYLSRVASVPDRVPMLIAYPVTVVDEHYNYTGSPARVGCWPSRRATRHPASRRRPATSGSPPPTPPRWISSSASWMRSRRRRTSPSGPPVRHESHTR